MANIETEQFNPQGTAIGCKCQGECQCGKYKTIRPVYYEVDFNSLNDWD
jgi:hypothetical protein